MNSAETINRGNLKIAAYPVFDLDADATGLVGRLGYGFADRFDAEGRIALYDELLYFAGDLELWLVKGQRIDFSIGAGVHRLDYESRGDVFGVDAVAIVSGRLSDQVELYGSLDLDFERSEGRRDDFTRAHLAGGFEVALSDDLDFLVEVGLGLNDDSSEYLSAGLAFYLR